MQGVNVGGENRINIQIIVENHASDLKSTLI